MLLTVAVPTIPGRESLLSRCLSSIVGQAPATVEVLVIEGPGLLGDKVNLAASEAVGDYMTVVDDDDWLAADYMSSVVPLCDGVDYVGLKVLEMENGRYSATTATSGEFNQWGRGNRGPVPKGVTRTELWRAHPMGNEYSADRAWLGAVQRDVHTWAFVDRPLYLYDYWSTGSAFHNGAARDVGWWPYDPDRVRRIAL